MNSYVDHWIGILGLLVGVIGTAYAYVGERKFRTYKSMFEQQCVTRVRNLVYVVSRLSQSTNAACQIKAEHFDELMTGSCTPEVTVRYLRELSDSIHALDVSTGDLQNFCERLNEEHQREFGQPVFESVRNQFPQHPKIPVEPSSKVAERAASVNKMV